MYNYIGDSPPPNDISSWFKCQGWGRTGDKMDHDIYAIGTQESGMNEREWLTKIKNILKSITDCEYEKIASETLWGIRMLILVKEEHSKKISHVEHAIVRTGIGNKLGNKGAVGISFYFNNTSLGFISAHLTSGTEKCNRRNQNYHDILKGMVPLKHKNMSQFDLTHQFNHLFFFGDLNYRVPINSEEIIMFAKNENLAPIYCADQLKGEMEKKKVFVGFEEAPILFPPTYRFAKGHRTMDHYVYVKKKRSGDRINEPSYCDRVLWKSYPDSRISNTSYGCTCDITTSDHSPIYATFQIGGFKQHFSDKVTASSSQSSNTFIVINSCSAKILTSSRTHFYIEMHSDCFQATKTDHSKDFISSDEGILRPKWKEPVAKIVPIMTDQSYIEQQYIFMMLKSTDSDEPYGNE
jgi:phosphatidylinositol-3,4,5-trisphosphate 5-phosphatase 2